MAGLPPFAAPNRRRRWLRVRYVAASLAGLLMLFYAEENWRGARAWHRARLQAEAGGSSLDWSTYIAPAVPDQLNVFKDPKMAEWFSGNGRTDLNRRFGTLDEFSKTSNTNVLANVFIVSPGADSGEVPADLELRYRFSTLSPAPTHSPGAEPEVTVIPLIVMDEVPLTDAIKHLARQAELTYILDPRLGLGTGAPQPTVTIRWENVTAEQALNALLNNYGLRWVAASHDGVARVVPSDSTEPNVYVAPAAQEQIATLIAGALAKSSEPAPTVLPGAQGIPLLSAPLAIDHPVRVAVISSSVPSAKEISAFFSTKTLTSRTHASTTLRVEPAGSNVFQVLLGPPAYYTAAEYLAWSDQFTNDFELMRQALRRPMARRAFDDDPAWRNRPNFVSTRRVSQTLAQRAQCWLLLGRPGEALNELTLLHDLCRLLEPDSTGHHASVVPAMIYVAVTGLYVSVIADGLHLHAWHQPQLITFQEQLKAIDLPPLLVGALQRERAALCWNFADLGARKLVQSDLFDFGPPRALNSWQRLKRTGSYLLAAAPRGWVDQNVALACDLEQRAIDVFDRSSRTIQAGKASQIRKANEQAFAHISPYNFMAAIAVPDFSRAWHAVAQYQARVCQAQIACALERYRLMLHDYPEALSFLVPQYAAALPLDVVSREPLHYRRLGPSEFVLYSPGWSNENENATNASGSKLPDAIPPDAWVWQ